MVLNKTKLAANVELFSTAVRILVKNEGVSTGVRDLKIGTDFIYNIGRPTFCLVF